MQRKKKKSPSGRPFHETLIDAINQASSAEMDCLAFLIKITKIPRGYDEIIAAWKKRRRAILWGTEDLGVPAYLRAQKLAAMEKSKPHDDENESMQERLQNLHKLTSQALGK
ncbi:MAG: hypothetical protein AAB450_01570 [Patescibacteria group bacterium]